MKAIKESLTPIILLTLLVMSLIYRDETFGHGWITVVYWFAVLGACVGYLFHVVKRLL